MNGDPDDTVISVPASLAAADVELDALGETVIISGRSGTAPNAASTELPALSVPAVPADFAVRIGAAVVTTLQVPLIVGRRPRTPRIVDGPVPRLLAVRSPQKEVSASHLSIRQLGSSLVVTDLKSTNGSVVAVPGSVPRRLRQGESVVVGAGALVDIGDGNVVEVLVGPAALAAGRQR